MTAIAPISIVYFGTPAYAVPALDRLASDPRFDVRLVVTQPDRPAGRGHAVTRSAVAETADRLGLPLYQPQSLRTAVEREPLVAMGANVFVVAAYGIIFGPRALAIPRFGCLNLHASLLPKYRGASPVTAAILAGDATTGVTLMQMDAGMDTGGIVASSTIPILLDDTTGTLTERLALVSAGLVVSQLPEWVTGNVTAQPQPVAGASSVRPLVKADGWIDWREPAVSIERRIRAMQPWPRAFTTTPTGATLQILQARPEESVDGRPGYVSAAGRSLKIGCGDGALLLQRVQPAGAGAMDGAALLQGRRLADGDLLGAVNAPDPLPPLIRHAG
jgi:methionyl-tRNA formyltransferase